MTSKRAPPLGHCASAGTKSGTFGLASSPPVVAGRNTPTSEAFTSSGARRGASRRPPLTPSPIDYAGAVGYAANDAPIGTRTSAIRTAQPAPNRRYLLVSGGRGLAHSRTRHEPWLEDNRRPRRCASCHLDPNRRRRRRCGPSLPLRRVRPGQPRLHGRTGMSPAAKPLGLRLATSSGRGGPGRVPVPRPPPHGQHARGGNGREHQVVVTRERERERDEQIANPGAGQPRDSLARGKRPHQGISYWQPQRDSNPCRHLERVVS